MKGEFYMIKLVYGNNAEEESRDEIKNQEEVEKGQVLVANLPKRKVVHLSGQQREAYLKAYDCVVTHDFGDEYHLTEEERKKKNQYYDLFKPLRKMRHTIRRLDEYVVAMRQVMHCIDVISENNGLYDPEEFKNMVLRKEVTIFGLFFPKYKGKNRKTLSTDYLAEFIMSDKDPEELMLTSSSITTLGSKEHLKEMMFTDEELDSLVETVESDRGEYINPDEGWVVEGLSRKKNSSLIRNSPEIITAAKEIKREAKKNSDMESLAYDFTKDDIGKIQEYDMKRGYIDKNSDEIPRYKGGSVDKYIAELDDYERSHIKFNYHGRMFSIEEIEEIELKEMLSENGWNILAFANNRDETKKLNKIRKADEKREKKLKKKLKRTQDRLDKNAEALGYHGKHVKKRKKKNKKEDD